MENMEEQMAVLNRLYKEQNELYRVFAAGCGLSVASFWVLYTLCSTQEVYSQQDMCNAWFYPKQTINSAIHHLTQDGYVCQMPVAGTRHRKAVMLTQEGKGFCLRHIVPLLYAEQKAFARFSTAERENFLALFSKQIEFLKEEIKAESK